MTQIQFLEFIVLASSFLGSLLAIKYGAPPIARTAAFRNPIQLPTPAPTTEVNCPLGTILTNGKCVLKTTICEKGKSWSNDEQRCICPEKDTEYNKDLLMCIKGGVWTPTFENKVPEIAFVFTDLPQTGKLHPVKIRVEGRVVIGKFNDKYGVVNFDDASVQIGSSYDEIFTTTELSFKGNSTSRVSGNYLTFRLKGDHEISVKFLSQNQCFSISIAVMTNHFIGIHKCSEEFASTIYVKEDLLSSTEHRGFWVYWNSSRILMGLEGDLNPRIQLKEKKIDPFTTVQYYSGENVEWQVHEFF